MMLNSAGRSTKTLSSTITTLIEGYGDCPILCNRFNPSLLPRDPSETIKAESYYQLISAPETSTYVPEID